VRDTSYTCDVV